MTLSLTNCESEYESWYSRGCCIDCGSQLRDDATGDLVPLPAEAERDPFESNGHSAEFEKSQDVVQRFRSFEAFNVVRWLLG
jgi:hypothetical protein